MKWDELSMKDRAKYIKMGITSGLESLDDIKEAYNRFDAGGWMDMTQSGLTNAGATNSEVRPPLSEVQRPQPRNITRSQSSQISPQTNRRAKYDSYVPQEVPSSGQITHPVTISDTHYGMINEAMKGLRAAGATKEQAIGILANAYIESKFDNSLLGDYGRAKGYFQQQAGERALYEKYLKDNKLEDNLTNASVFVYHEMNKNNRETPYSTKDKNPKFYNRYWADVPLYQGVTTDMARERWNKRNVDSTTDAITILYEKPSIPHDDQRRSFANQLVQDHGIYWGTEDLANINASGGNLYKEGGPTNTNSNFSKSGLIDWINSKGRTKIGTRKYDNTTPFKTAFRETRDAGDSEFFWNGNKYNTELAEDEFVRRNSEMVPSNLWEVGFRKLAIREPDKYRDIQNRKDRRDSIARHPYLSRIPRDLPYSEINETIATLRDMGLSQQKVAGMIGNMISESGGRNRKQVGGSADGYYQMEPVERKNYNKWLKEKGLKGTLRNESIYIAEKLLDTNSDLRTPYDHMLLDNNGKEDYSKYRTAGLSEYRGVTTKKARDTWDSGTIDGATEAFLQLFERAGKPELETRKFISNILFEDPNIKW